MDGKNNSEGSSMIPKKIHYVWLGGAEKPAAIRRCMRTWRRLSGYEFIEWNESNIDIDSHPFLKKAVDKKQWAFASDYIRAWAVYNLAECILIRT